MSPCRRSDPLRLAQAFGLAVLGLGVAALGHWAGARAGTTPTPNPFLRVALSPIPGLSVAARLIVVAPGATHVVVRYGPEVRLLTAAPRFVMPPSGKLSTALIGLHPAATSHVEVVAQFPDGTATSSGELTVTTPSMDPKVPETLPVVDDGKSSGVVMLSMNGGEDVRGLAVIVDRRGRVLWYRHCGGGAFDFERLPNGRLILYEDEAHAFEELELDGTVVHEWTDPRSLNGTDGHDFKLLPNGNALLFGAETHRVHPRPYFATAAETVRRWDDTVSEVTRSGATVWRWSSYSHETEDEITRYSPEPFDPRDYEVVHTNSIEPLLDGSLLLSFRNLSSVAKIDRTTGRVMWHLGGTRSDFRFETDPLGGFSRQHDARLVGPGRVLLFDNGNLHDPPVSRAVEYRLDEGAKTATLIWEYRHSPPIFSHVSGCVQRLPDGHTLVAWGPRGIVSEADARSKTVWELTLPHFGVYRARTAPTLYP